VPADFADRLVAPELTRAEFLCHQGSSPTPVLFVVITSVDFSADRVGYNPANPPTDDELRDRLECWWQLKRFLPGWIAEPESSPGLLIGIYGSPGRQLVIAAARIDRGGWSAAESKGGKIRVPLLPPGDLDAYALRGRRVERPAGIRFGGITTEFFVLLDLDGNLRGGQHSRRETRLL
jgi:hypothetical protein